jgi:ribokinase
VRRLFVLGNASIDVSLAVPRLPLPGETLMASGLTRAPGGKGLNQAVVAARCGIPVHFCAPLGAEAEADGVRAALARENFAALDLVDTGRPTDLSTLLVGPDGENCIVSTGDGAFSLDETRAAAFVAGMGARDILLLQGNLTEAASVAAARVAPCVIFNTAPLRWPTERLLALCRVIIANEVEAAEITDVADPRVAARRLAEATRGGWAVVTIGGRGCVVAGAGGEASVSAPRVAAVDTTGAGDTFCGALAAALARDVARDAAIAAAQAAAALSVTRAGCFAALPTAGELAAIFAGR